MINIFIALLALAVGIYVGSIIFGRESAQIKQETDRNSPLVICMVFHKRLTKESLLEVLKPRAVQIAMHFGLPVCPVSKDLWDSLDPLADKIMKWYNPEYCQLVLVAHRDTPEGRVALNWTWAIPSYGAEDEL